MSFQDTENKDAIRRLWDAPIIEAWQSEIGRPLKYFGLTGPDIHDLLDWHSMLAKERTGVESYGRSRDQRELAAMGMSRLIMNLHVNKISAGFQLLRGDIEDVIINATDTDGNPPQLNDGAVAQSMHFYYDLINLDFDGGLGYRDGSGRSKRIKAIKRLFERQEFHNFLLLLTINVRHTLGNEIEEYIGGLLDRQTDGVSKARLEWYLSRTLGESEYKLKAIVPTFIQNVGEMANFQCKCYPPVAYVGHRNAKMVHFAFELRRANSNLRAFSRANDADLISMPLIESYKGKLRLAENQHPGFDVSTMNGQLSFLREKEQKAIIAPSK